MPSVGTNRPNQNTATVRFVGKWWRIKEHTTQERTLFFITTLWRHSAQNVIGLWHKTQHARTSVENWPEGSQNRCVCVRVCACCWWVWVCVCVWPLQYEVVLVLQPEYTQLRNNKPFFIVKTMLAFIFVVLHEFYHHVTDWTWHILT